MPPSNNELQRTRDGNAAASRLNSVLSRRMQQIEFERWWEQFRRTGDICPIRLGMSREQLKAALGDPEVTGGATRRHPRAVIWKYGELEFHFRPDADQLALIYMERNGVVDVSIPRSAG